MSTKAESVLTEAKAPVNITDKDRARFWRKVNKDGPLPDQSNPHYAGLGPCWLWIGTIVARYGYFKMSGKLHRAHRLQFLMEHGYFPRGGMACHQCDNPICVNPEHLFDGDSLRNVSDMGSKGRRRSVVGEKSPNARLTAVQVYEMRRVHAENGVSQRQLSRLLGMSLTAVHFVIRRKNWK